MKHKLFVCICGCIRTWCVACARGLCTMCAVCACVAFANIAAYLLLYRSLYLACSWSSHQLHGLCLYSYFPQHCLNAVVSGFLVVLLELFFCFLMLLIVCFYRFSAFILVERPMLPLTFLSAVRHLLAFRASLNSCS